VGREKISATDRKSMPETPKYLTEVKPSSTVTSDWCYRV
jgi:hypothetical protein